MTATCFTVCVPSARKEKEAIEKDIRINEQQEIPIETGMATNQVTARMVKECRDAPADYLVLAISLKGYPALLEDDELLPTDVYEVVLIPPW